MNQQTCATPVLLIAIALGICQANPTLPAGTWVNISPTGGGISWGGSNTMAMRMAIDPNNPDNLFVCLCTGGCNAANPKGLYKSTDAGSSWFLLHEFDSPNTICIDPKNSNHLYLSDAVCGGTNDLWATTDGGTTWAVPPGFDSVERNAPGGGDVYHVAVDPTDFNHFLCSFHNCCAGAVVESFDGGAHCIRHNISQITDGGGYNVYFLYDPKLGIGDSRTWLYTTQAAGSDAGFWRTTNSGASWDHVWNTPMPHGGDDGYYTKEGVLYWGTQAHPIRSTDNGASWVELTNTTANKSYYTIIGDGSLLYILPDDFGNGADPFLVSSETDGVNWTPFNGGKQTFSRGPFYLCIDTTHQIIYACLWEDGVWALQSNNPNVGMNLTNAHANPSSAMDNATSTVTFSVDATAQQGVSTVTIDLSSIGGSATTPMTKGSGNTYAVSYTLNPGSAPGLHSLPILATDLQNHTQHSAVSFTIQDHAEPVLVSQGKTVVVSSSQGADYPGSAAVDGNMSTRWSSGAGDPQWIYIDLGSSMAVNRVVLMWETAYAKSYKIQVSTDASNWTDVYSTTAGDGGTDSITFQQANARYIRMYGTERGTAYGYSLYEFEVYSPAPPSQSIALQLSANLNSQKPMCTMSSNKISISVANSSTPWALDLWSLNGSRIASFDGYGSTNISLANKNNPKEFMIAKLKGCGATKQQELVIPQISGK